MFSTTPMLDENATLEEPVGGSTGKGKGKALETSDTVGPRKRLRQSPTPRFSALLPESVTAAGHRLPEPAHCSQASNSTPRHLQFIEELPSPRTPMAEFLRQNLRGNGDDPEVSTSPQCLPIDDVDDQNPIPPEMANRSIRDDETDQNESQPGKKRRITVKFPASVVRAVAYEAAQERVQNLSANTSLRGQNESIPSAITEPSTASVEDNRLTMVPRHIPVIVGPRAQEKAPREDFIALMKLIYGEDWSYRAWKNHIARQGRLGDARIWNAARLAFGAGWSG